MGRTMSRRARRVMRNVNRGGEDVMGFIEENPLTSAFIALATGAVATSVYKIATSRPAAKAGSAGNNSKSRSSAPRKKSARKAR